MAATVSTLLSVTPKRWQHVRPAGAGNIVRKEWDEWLRTRRLLFTAVLATLIMLIIPVGVWIVDHHGLSAGRATLSAADAADIRGAGTGTLLTISAYGAILLTMSMLVKERDAGTAQWLFTKPVSRAGYGLAKWAANSLAVLVATVLIPAALSLVVVPAIYRIPDWSWRDQILAVGVVAVHVPVVVALMLVLGTVFRTTVPVAVTALGASAAPMAIAPLVGDDVRRAFPVFRFGDLVSAVANGHAVGAGDLTPVGTSALFLAVCLGVACRRLTREQLQ